MRLRPTLTTAATLVALLAAAPVAQAWETRVITLGDQNRFLEDDANIWLYPQKTLKYANRLYLDLSLLRNFDPDATFDYFFIEDPAILQNAGGGGLFGVTDALAVGFWVSDFEDDVSQQFLALARVVQTPKQNIHANVLSGQNIVPGDLSGRVRGGFPETTHRPERFDDTQVQNAEENASRKFDLFLGFDLGTLDLGGHLAFGKSSLHVLSDVTTAGNTQKPANEPLDFDTWQFLLGLGTTVGFSPDSYLDVGFEFDWRDLSWDEGETGFLEFDDGKSVQLDSRFRFRLSRSWWLVPSLQLQYDAFSGFIPNDRGGNALSDANRNWQTEVKWSHVDFDLGVGGHMRVDESFNVFLATGLDVDSNSLSSSSAEGGRDIKTTTWQLPYVKGGFEGALFDWAVFRAGFAKFVAWQNYEDEAFQSKKDSVGRPSVSDFREWDTSLVPGTGAKSFFTFVGASFHYRGWNFDVQIDPQLLFKGPNDNNQGGYPWFNRFTIGYLW